MAGSAAEQPERSAAELMAQVIDQLPAADRKRVLAWLIDRSPQRTGALPAAEDAGLLGVRERALGRLPAMDPVLRKVITAHAQADPALRQALDQQLFSGALLRGEHQVVPVRLPAELHGRLRDWCTEHGFSMATVVRGLVARFLDGQAPGAGPAG